MQQKIPIVFKEDIIKLSMPLKEMLKKLKSTWEISLSFAKANFKLRNEGSYLGILWYLLEPILFLIILLQIRSLTGQGSIPHYPIYLFLGLIMFNFFMSVTTNSTNSMRSKAKFIKNMLLPKESLVLSTSIQFMFSHIFELIILIMLMLFYKVSLITLLLYIPIFAIFLAFTLGTSFILSTLGVYINDLKNIWAVFTRILWFVTPIFYAYNAKSGISIINYINPLTHFLNIAREIVIYHHAPNIRGLLILIIISIAIFSIGLFVFNKYKNKFAEKI